MKTLCLILFTALILSCGAPKTTQSTMPESGNADVTASIPNTFTPNADGQNDVLCFESVFNKMPGAVVKIYSRWGVQVWENAEAKKCWDGIDFKTKSALPTGVYYYNIHPKTGADISGNVTLMR